MRNAVAILAALALGCGSAQYAVGPSEEVLTAEAPPHHPTEKETWCPPPPEFPREIMLIVGDTCWVEVDTTQDKCAQYIREQPSRYMRWSGRCWFFRYEKPKRQPTSGPVRRLGSLSVRGVTSSDEPRSRGSLAHASGRSLPVQSLPHFPKKAREAFAMLDGVERTLKPRIPRD